MKNVKQVTKMTSFSAKDTNMMIKYNLIKHPQNTCRMVKRFVACHQQERIEECNNLRSNKTKPINIIHARLVLIDAQIVALYHFTAYSFSIAT